MARVSEHGAEGGRLGEDVAAEEGAMEAGEVVDGRDEAAAVEVE